MSGICTWLQARIKDVNPLVDYMYTMRGAFLKFSWHVIKRMLFGCLFIFISFLQQIYDYVTASTHRWDILLSKLRMEFLTLKSLSNARWFARDDSCRSLSNSHGLKCAMLWAQLGTTLQTRIVHGKRRLLFISRLLASKLLSWLCRWHAWLDVSKQLTSYCRQ